MNESVNLQSHELIAYNYGVHHANRIHSDEGAAQYGFRAALVPGVALYAYCTQAAVRHFGVDWLTSGAISARFAQPIYDGERITIAARPLLAPESALEIELIKADGAVSTRAIASNNPTDAEPSSAAVAEFEMRALPEEAGRRAPRNASFEAGEPLGTLEFVAPLSVAAESFVADMRDPLNCYRGANARVHPAHWIAQANRVLTSNIRLGAWIHTASEVQHFGQVDPGQKLSLRARIRELQNKRGHEIISTDMILLDEGLRPIATIRHSAIIHLAPKA
jgi:hypothetical protein